MNTTADPLLKIKDILLKNNSGIICLAQNPSIDSIASATALYHALIKLGKNVSLVCSSPIQSDLAGTDKIQSSFASSGNNLMISLPYADGAIDKVDYSISEDRFNLIITPHEGFPRLDSKQVKFSYAGGTINFAVTIDAVNLKSLGQVFADNQKQLEGKDIVNIDRHLTNSYFGTVNYVTKTASSTSEIILKILRALGTEIDREIATNLYTGLSTVTNSFSSFSVNADTFETAAYLLKLGAKKNSMKNSHNSSPNHSVSLEKQVVKPIESVEQEAGIVGEGEKTPDDWLKPKIFKSGGDLV